MNWSKWYAAVSLSLCACSSTARGYHDPVQPTEGGAGAAHAGAAGQGTSGGGSADAGAAGQAGEANAASEAGTTVDAAGTDAASDSPAVACTAQEAFDWSALPTSFAWQSWYWNEGNVHSVKCVNEPCGACTLTWNEAFGADWDTSGTRLTLVVNVHCAEIPVYSSYSSNTCIMAGSGDATVALTTTPTSEGYAVSDSGATGYDFSQSSSEGTCGQFQYPLDDTLRATQLESLKQTLLGTAFSCP